MIVETKKMIRKGRCQRCGRCCSFDKLAPSELKELIRNLDIAIPDCPHLTRDGLGICSCEIYEKRPWFCKAYPAEPADLVVGCGFYFEGGL